ncbi:hypothetical protein JTE90_012807 [Oedothorax gibbosus]|uniref:EB domain-containing protein n=1 Tax=Oedothorax gibbosus TaxID=931172 RepID=A0AAV6VXK5_9ARAC|nr:hypothetical protein JTE90_012807 [Oedothorax gibbosus]
MCSNVVTIVIIFVYDFKYSGANLDNVEVFTSKETTKYNVNTGISGTQQANTLEISKMFNVKKQASHLRNLGERCTMSRDCLSNALCKENICSCPTDYYAYMPSPKLLNLAICRLKIKHGFRCTLTQDCSEHDTNSECSGGVCQCIEGTHYLRTDVLFSHVKRCYNTSLSEGDVCDIHDQCFGLEDGHHKCRCTDGHCTCTNGSEPSGCLICKENITSTLLVLAGITLCILTLMLLVKLRHRANSRYAARNLLNSRPTAPPLPNTETNLSSNRDVTSSLPNVFFTETRHSLLGVNNGYMQTRCSSTSALRSEDLPPSYDDIMGSLWNEPPPSYQEIAAKVP